MAGLTGPTPTGKPEIGTMPRRRHLSISIPVINLETGMPLVHEALAQLDRELSSARKQKRVILKVIHGYGSTGKGGHIRIAVQQRLRELQDQGVTQLCIFGEDWSMADTNTWMLLKSH